MEVNGLEERGATFGMYKSVISPYVSKWLQEET